MITHLPGKLTCIIRTLLLTAFGLLFITISNAQEIEWQNTIGGSGNDYLYSIQQTTDGGYILGGFSKSNISGDKTENNIGVWDYWIVKTDAAGNIQWQNTIGGNENDFLNTIQQTADGGYILGGTSWSVISGDKTENRIGAGMHSDYWIVKTDAAGSIQWQNTIGGSDDDYLVSIRQTADGGYILGGSSDSNISGDKTENSVGVISNPDYWIVKTDSLGNIQWQNTIGGNGGDLLYSIQQTTDGGYIIGGSSNSNISGDKTENSVGGNSFDYWIVKTDAAGNIQWQNTIGGNGGDILYSIQQTADGGYILGGRSQSSISGDKTENNWDTTFFTHDFWIVITDSSGNIQWQNNIGGSGDDLLFSIQQTTDSGYILGGVSPSNSSGDKTENSNGYYDYWIVKTDAAGNIQWQNTIGGSSNEELYSIRQTTDGGYILGGSSVSNISGDKTENTMGLNGSDYWIVKLTDKYNTITGKCFLDFNSNNVQEAGEPNLSNKKITVQNTGRFAFAQQNGSYNLVVLDSGNFSVSPGAITHFNAVPVTHSAYFSGIHQTDSVNDFAIQPAGVISDLRITISPLTPFRSGFNATYTMHYENVGTTTLNASIVFYLNDSNYNYLSASVSPALVTTDSVVWNNISLVPFQSGDITVTVYVNPGLPIGTQLNALCLINPLAGDATQGDNWGSWKVFTTGAVDPNDILVDEDTLTTVQLAGQPYLEYIIRFQNTGNDTCFNTKILNPIDTSKLELSSIEFVASSHPVNLKWIPWERNMEFKFDNILLPDSNINAPLSHGYVRYRIKPKTSLSAGDSVLNNAAIYFDFNYPVLTNVAKTKIVLPTTYATISASACYSYLSPSGNYLWIATGTYTDTLVNVYGGDSIITVNLIITHSTSSLININACDFQTSPSGNYTWTASGIFNDTIPNAVGCDSIITINLTINNSSSSAININSCDSYTSPSGNYLWTTTGTYNDTIPNATGCDSIITINLLINNSTSSIINVNYCDSYTSPSGIYTWTISGVYHDTIPNTIGCDSVITINLSVTTVDTSVTFTAPSLTANATSATYQWMYCDSALISGATNQSFIATANGSYAVIVFQNGCEDTSSCYSVLNVGIAEVENQSAIKVYPNPAKDRITISGNSLKKGTVIKIADVMGKEVYNSMVTSQKSEVSTRDFSNGIYFVQIQTPDFIETRKLIIAR